MKQKRHTSTGCLTRGRAAGVPFYWLVCLVKNKEAIQSTGKGGQETMAAQRFAFLVGACAAQASRHCAFSTVHKHAHQV